MHESQITASFQTNQPLPSKMKPVDPSDLPPVPAPTRPQITAPCALPSSSSSSNSVSQPIIKYQGLRDGVVYADLALSSAGLGHGVKRKDRPTEYAVLTFCRDNTASEV